MVKPGEISSVPTHPADDDIEGLDAEIAIAHNQEVLLEQADAAMERIRTGTFGVCQKCRRTIAPERCRPFLMRPSVLSAPLTTRTRSNGRCAVNRDASAEFTLSQGSRRN